MNKLMCFSFFISLFFLQRLLAENPSRIKIQNCPDRLQAFENIQLQQTESGDGKRCYLSIHPRNAFETMIYRDYLLTNDGMLMVFNSFSDKENSTSDGAREFYFLPSQDVQNYQWTVENENLVITGFVGKVLKFNLKTAQLDFLTGAVLKLAEEVVPGNKGGLEILRADYIHVDAGFKFRNSPASDRSRSSDVKNASGQSCRMKNSKIYTYLNDSVYLKQIEDLKKTVKATCPNFLM